MGAGIFSSILSIIFGISLTVLAILINIDIVSRLYLVIIGSLVVYAQVWSIPLRILLKRGKLDK